MNVSIGYGLMCKPPRPGLSKTRLAASIGPEAAARISRALLEDSASAAITAAQELKLELTAFFRPADAAAEMRNILGNTWRFVFADAGDLGATMLEALRELLTCNPDGALITGADVPLMSPRDIAAACLALEQTHAKGLVIQPSWDGGYCMIGIKCAVTAAPLFDPLPWGTPVVYQATLDRARALGFSITILPRQRDIDDISDLDWLRAQLTGEHHHAQSTRRLLRSRTLALPSANTPVCN
jgi:uncharacterized protein